MGVELGAGGTRVKGGNQVARENGPSSYERREKIMCRAGENGGVGGSRRMGCGRGWKGGTSEVMLEMAIC
jgi:hypothetical protein